MRTSKCSQGTTQKPVQFQSLESRVLFCAYHDGLGNEFGSFPAVHTNSNQSSNHAQTRTAAHGSGTSLNVPALNSLVGGHATIYLDFDGDSSSSWGSYNPGTTPAYDIDGNASS